MTLPQYKEAFIKLYKENIKREGADKLLAFLLDENKSDFFTAPASTRFHLNEEGGLLMHSLHVAEVMMDFSSDKYPEEERETKESCAICGLLHDICKTNFYKKSLRNQKNEKTGQWEKVPFYQIEDSFPYGHGEKSVYMIERFFKLTGDEAIAIRWHMGGFDEAAKGGSFAVSQAYSRYPLAVKLHISDFYASHIIETKQERAERKLRG